MRRIRSPFAPLLLSTLVVAAVACGDDSVTPAGSDISIVPGTTYVLADAEGIDVPESSALQMTFEAGTLAVSGGCNQMGGGYTIEDGTLEVTDMNMTAMACEDSLMTFDEEVAAFLGSSPSVAVAGDVLTLATGEVTMTLREPSDVADAPLEGTTWTVTGTIQGDSTQSLNTQPATILMENGTAQIFSGCNSGTAEYTIDGTNIKWEPMALTKMACSAEAMQMEAAVANTLHGTTGYDIEGTKLVIQQGTDGLTLTSA